MIIPLLFLVILGLAHTLSSLDFLAISCQPIDLSNLRKKVGQENNSHLNSIFNNFLSNKPFSAGYLNSGFMVGDQSRKISHYLSIFQSVSLQPNHKSICNRFQMELELLINFKDNTNSIEFANCFYVLDEDIETTWKVIYTIKGYNYPVNTNEHLQFIKEYYLGINLKERVRLYISLVRQIHMFHSHNIKINNINLSRIKLVSLNEQTYELRLYGFSGITYDNQPLVFYSPDFCDFELMLDQNPSMLNDIFSLGLILAELEFPADELYYGISDELKSGERVSNSYNLIKYQKLKNINRLYQKSLEFQHMDNSPTDLQNLYELITLMTSKKRIDRIDSLEDVLAMLELIKNGDNNAYVKSK